MPPATNAVLRTSSQSYRRDAVVEAVFVVEHGADRDQAAAAGDEAEARPLERRVVVAAAVVALAHRGASALSAIGVAGRRRRHGGSAAASAGTPDRTTASASASGGEPEDGARTSGPPGAARGSRFYRVAPARRSTTSAVVRLRRSRRTRRRPRRTAPAWRPRSPRARRCGAVRRLAGRDRHGDDEAGGAARGDGAAGGLHRGAGGEAVVDDDRDPAVDRDAGPAAAIGGEPSIELGPFLVGGAIDRVRAEAEPAQDVLVEERDAVLGDGADGQLRADPARRACAPAARPAAPRAPGATSAATGTPPRARPRTTTSSRSA